MVDLHRVGLREAAAVGALPSAEDTALGALGLTREALRALPDVAFFVFDHELRFCFCEGGGLRGRGLDPMEFEGRTLLEVPVLGVDKLALMYRRALAGETLRLEIELSGRPLSVRAAPVWSADGRVIGGSLLSVDLTERDASDQVRRESLERVDRIAANVPGVVYQVRLDADGVFGYSYVSEGIRDVVGIEPAALRADPSLLLRLIHPDDVAGFSHAMAKAWAESEQSHWEGRFVLADGEVRWLRISSRPQLMDGDAQVRDGVAIDITDQRLAEDSARWRLEHDPLTGLPTRALALECLEQALADARTGGCAVGVCVIDIDHFTQINHAVGLGAGDAALRELSERIGSSLRQEDFIARLGGDELVVVLPGLPDREAARALAERIASTCRAPLRTGSSELLVSCSIGLAVAPDDCLAAEQLLRQADAAKRRAKERGRDRVEAFDAELAAQAEERTWLEQRLRHAIERHELHLVYQPQISLLGACESAEALLRWHPEGHDPVSPGVFIPLAEETGLIAPIGAWVLRHACETAATWLEERRPLRICVNLSACQLADRRLGRLVARTLAETGLPAYLLELELTETAIMEHGAVVNSTLKDLRTLGVRVSLDDFGTESSSLARLRNLPLDALKIDASFIAEIGDGQATAFVKGIIGLGHTLGLEVVAEGVETAEQRRVLETLACDRLQGYLIGYPKRDFKPGASTDMS